MHADAVTGAGSVAGPTLVLPRTLFLLHEQRHLYFDEPSFMELYLPMTESGLLGETMAHAFQRDLRFARQITAGFKTDAAGAGAGVFDQLLEQKIIEFRPDLVVYALTWPEESIPTTTLQRLKLKHDFQLVSVIWDHDESNPLLQRYDRDVIAVSDCSIVADSLTRTRAIHARSGPYGDFENTGRVVFLPTVPPASLFFPRPGRRHEITISGSGEGHRTEIYKRLLGLGFPVHRSGGMMPADALLPVAAYAEDLATSAIVINTQTQGSRTQVKGRVAQCLASGTFLLEQDNAESRAYLQGIDVVLWQSFDELTQLLRHHLANAEEREAMARRAHEQWRARYSARSFVETIFQTLSATPGATPLEAVATSTASDAPAIEAVVAAAPPPPPALREAAPAAAAARNSPAYEGAPMRFYIFTGNHNSHHGIADTVLFLKNALQDCGHTACISHTVVPGHINLVMEHFVEDKHLRDFVAGHSAGARYILIGTEPISGGTFNGGIDGTHWHYSNTDYWKLRFESFKAAAGLAEAIWVLAESMLPGYGELFPRLPVRFLPHGYVDDFATVRQRAEEERDIDFYFSGTLTDHRKRILSMLNSTHRVTLNDSATPEYLRQDHLSRAKVCLSLRLSPQNVIPSVSRMHFHLQNKSFVLQERYALASPLDPFVMHAPEGDMVPWALSALDLDNRRQIADAMHQRFKFALPMKTLLPPLIDEVLARVSLPLRMPIAEAA